MDACFFVFFNEKQVYKTKFLEILQKCKKTCNKKRILTHKRGILYVSEITEIKRMIF